MKLNYHNQTETEKMTTDSILNNKLEKIANNNNVVTNNNCHKKDNQMHENQIQPEEMDNRKSLILLAAIFLSSLIAMIYIYNFFPELDE